MLLSRNRGGMVLTADGRAVLPKIEELCAAHHALMQTVEGLKDCLLYTSYTNTSCTSSMYTAVPAKMDSRVLRLHRWRPAVTATAMASGRP